MSILSTPPRNGWSMPLSPDTGARNQVGIGLSYQPAILCSLATQFQTRFLESIPRPIAGLKFPTQNPGINSEESIPSAYVAWQADTITIFLLSS